MGVESCLESSDSVPLHTMTSHGNQKRPFELRLLAHKPRDLEAIQLGHAEIKKDNLRLELQRYRQGQGRLRQHSYFMTPHFTER